jgi:hypothetical protein
MVSSESRDLQKIVSKPKEEVVPVVKFTNEETKAYVLSEERNINNITEPTSKATKQAYQFLRYFVNGQSSTQDAYEAAKIARDACQAASLKLGNLTLTELLPDSIHSMLREIISNASTAYFMRYQGYEMLMDYFDNGKPSVLSESHEKMDGADRFIEGCAVSLISIKMSLGIPIQNSKKKEIN